MKKINVLKTYNKATSFVASLFFYLFLISVSFVFVYPFIYMFSTSFMSFQDLNNVSVDIVPTKLDFSNYLVAIKEMSYFKTVSNSIILTLFATLGHIISGAFIGYGFARFNFPFKNILFFICILSSIIPIQVFIVPLYVNYSNLNMLNTYLPFILPAYLGYGLRGGIAVFLYRQYFYSFPTALEEAALLDGCGRVKSFFKIAFPSAGSITVVVAVLFTVWHWNDYYEPGLYLTKGSRYLVTQTLPRIYSLLSSESAAVEQSIEELVKYHDGVVMAATALATIPMLVVYFILQRKFVEGIEKTGLVG